MFTRLLVGLDGSPQSEVALAQAILIGRRFRATLVLAHILRLEEADPVLVRNLGAPWREGRPEPLEPIPEALAGAGAGLLEDAAGAVGRAGLTAERVVRGGAVVGQLLEMAESVDAVFVGRTGRHSGGDPLGPDTRELIRRAPTPVIVCGSTVSPMDRCAIAYDGQPASLQALNLAERYAQVAGARLDVIHSAENQEEGREVLAHAALALSGVPLDFETHLEPGDVDSAVPAAIGRLGSNALFAGAKREGGKVLVPSHTEAILRATDIPVVVHHVPQELSVRVSGTHRRTPS
jgi:nucleotide-binding universal stress UspA family protein